MAEEDFIAELIDIIGRGFVYTDPQRSEWYRTGFRSGEGEAEAVVQPGTLLELPIESVVLPVLDLDSML